MDAFSKYHEFSGVTITITQCISLLAVARQFLLICRTFYLQYYSIYLGVTLYSAKINEYDHYVYKLKLQRDLYVFIYFYNEQQLTRQTFNICVTDY